MMDKNTEKSIDLNSKSRKIHPIPTSVDQIISSKKTVQAQSQAPDFKRDFLDQELIYKELELNRSSGIKILNQILII